MIDVSSHRNVKTLLDIFNLFTTERINRILDVGGGCNETYKGVLQTRCNEYVNLDIRPVIS